MRTFNEFLEEAKRIRFLTVYRGDDDKEVAKSIQKNRSARSSEYGVYGPGVYASSDKNVARKYAGDAGDSGVTKSRIPTKRITTIRTPEHNDGDGIQKGREAVYGNPRNSVRIKNAASHMERTRNAPNKKPKGTESDYLVVNPDTFNRGITTQPTFRASGKPRRTKTQIPKTVEEAKRMRVLNLIHSTSRDNKKRIQDSGFKDSPSTGSYGQGVYTSPSRRVTRDYGHSDVNLRIVNPKVHSTDSPKQFRIKMRNWVKDSSDDDLVKGKNKPVDPRKQAKAAIESGKKIVRVPDAHENPTRKDLPRGSYVVVDKDVANRSIVKNPQPTFRASGKPRRTKTQPKRK